MIRCNVVIDLFCVVSESPHVKVSPDVIRESSSVKISCETPADVIVNQCYFHTNSEEKNIKTSSSCELDLTGAEVLRWASVKSPESIYIYCFYTIHERGINKPSHHSPPATVTVLGEIFYSCSSVLETTMFLITGSFLFEQIHFRNRSSVLVEMITCST